MEQKVRVELTNKGVAVPHSADEYLPHITRLEDYNGEWKLVFGAPFDSAMTPNPISFSRLLKNS